MSRTYLMAAYKFPRELNWLTGAVLLLLTLAMAFTGQLLRWDQNAVWSVIVGAAQAGRMPIVGPDLARFMLAGDTIGGATLSRFFAFHVFFIPALIFAFIGMHLSWCCVTASPSRRVAGEPVDPATYRAGTTRCSRGRACRSGPTPPGATWTQLFSLVLQIHIDLIFDKAFTSGGEISGLPDLRIELDGGNQRTHMALEFVGIGSPP